MIHITYKPSAQHVLSSGHILFEIFTTFIFVPYSTSLAMLDSSIKGKCYSLY